MWLCSLFAPCLDCCLRIRIECTTCMKCTLIRCGHTLMLLSTACCKERHSDCSWHRAALLFCRWRCWWSARHVPRKKRKKRNVARDVHVTSRCHHKTQTISQVFRESKISNFFGCVLFWDCPTESFWNVKCNVKCKTNACRRYEFRQACRKAGLTFRDAEEAGGQPGLVHLMVKHDESQNFKSRWGNGISMNFRSKI